MLTKTKDKKKVPQLKNVNLVTFFSFSVRILKFAWINDIVIIVSKKPEKMIEETS